MEVGKGTQKAQIKLVFFSSVMQHVCLYLNDTDIVGVGGGWGGGGGEWTALLLLLVHAISAVERSRAPFASHSRRLVGGWGEVG